MKGSECIITKLDTRPLIFLQYQTFPTQSCFDSKKIDYKNNRIVTGVYIFFLVLLKFKIIKVQARELSLSQHLLWLPSDVSGMRPSFRFKETHQIVMKIRLRISVDRKSDFDTLSLIKENFADLSVHNAR